jgi:AcrR family transcriptional regulator
MSVGTRERRQREFLDREQLFLAAARELIREQGLLNLQMSRIAEKCEYAVGTLYLHFSSKEDLLLALTTETAKEHVQLFSRAAAWQAGSRDRMFAIPVADSIFVRRNPEFFRIAQFALCEVVWLAASAERREDFLELATKPVGAVVQGIIEDAVTCGDLELGGLSQEALSLGFWALTNGTHNLVHAEGVVESFQRQDPYRLLCRHVNVMLNGFGWKPLVNPHDEAALDALIHRIENEVFHDCCPSA